MSTQQQIKRGGKRAKRMKNHAPEAIIHEVIIKDQDQEYAVVEKVLGGNRYTVKCYDGVSRLAHKRGKMTRGVHSAQIAQDDHILVSLRDYQNSKCDIIHKYTHGELRELRQRNELPNVVVENIVEDTGFDFESI